MVLNVNNNLSLNFNGKINIINVTEITTISVDTKEIFKNLGVISPNHLNLNYPLKEQAETLRSSMQKLQEAKDNEVKDKVFNTLRTALTIGILAGGILGVLALAWCPPAAIGIGLLAFAAYAALCGYNTYKADMMDILNIYMVGLVIVLAAGPFFPLYEAFGKVSRIQGIINNQKSEVETAFANFTPFFKSDLSHLKTQLANDIGKAKQSLLQLNQLPTQTQVGKNDIQQRLGKLEKALEELNKAIAFYSKY